jgi:anaerobic selenocysteine-containing dehydrogenase
VRAILCLPALIAAWRDAAGGALLSSSGHFPVANAALQRPDLLPGWPRLPRSVNMVSIGDALLAADPPIEALVVYNSNPVAVAPESGKVIRGFAREDLFTVVLEHFRTDTADYADFILPATTQLEHFDLHKSYGHRYVVVNEAAIAPLGQARPNSAIFRELAARMDLREPCFSDTDEQIAAAAFEWADPRLAGQSLDTVRAAGWVRLAVSDAPFAQGGFPTPSGRCEFFSQRLADQGHDPLPGFVAPHESAQSAAELARRYPLALITPPARDFLNSTFVNVPSLAAREKEPACELHPVDAARRGIAEGDAVRVFNDRGSFVARARVTEDVRPGVAVAFGVWWHKLSPGGRNVNAVTSQALSDLGGSPTFYDCLVEVGPA